MKKISWWILLGILPMMGGAQEGMTLDQAIATALRQNYSILIGQNNVEIAENQANWGQAGLLPTVSASGGVDYSNETTRIQLQNSEEVIETTGAESYVYNGRVQMNYTLFSGFANRLTLDRLGISAQLSKEQARAQAEGTILQVGAAFFNVQRAQENLRALTENAGVSSDRLSEAQTRKEYSGGSGLNVLNAQVDLNKDSVDLLNAQQAMEEAAIEFNRLLGRTLDEEVNLAAGPTFSDLNDYDPLLAAMKQQGSSMALARYNEQASLLDYKIAKSAYMPQLALNGSYAYNRVEAEGSFLALNETNGFGAGLTLSIPLYSGGTRSTAVKNASIAMDNRALELQEQEKLQESALLSAFKDYQNSQKVLAMEERNLTIAKQNFDYSKDRFDLGQITSTQFREAQLNLLLTQNNLNNVQYNVKLAEMELLRLTGRLIP